MKSFSSMKESELYFLAPFRLLQCSCVSPEGRGGGKGLGGLYCTSVQLCSVHSTSQLHERCIP
jgi:hypothetical protein